MKNRIFIGLILTFFSLKTYSQAVEWEWAKSGGGRSEDMGGTTAVDNKGNVFFAGNFNSQASLDATTLISNGIDDIFLSKHNSAGDLLWAKSFGGKNNDNVGGISVDESGNLYMIGNFIDTISFNKFELIGKGYQDFFIAKFDASGNFLWAKSAGNAEWDVGSGIAADKKGYVYATGSFQGPSLIMNGINVINVNDNRTYGYIVKFDTLGNIIWGKSMAKNVYSLSIKTDKIGSIYTTGYFGGGVTYFDSIAVTNRGSQDIFVAKYNPLGSLIWIKTAGGKLEDFSNNIDVDSKDNIYITGSFASKTFNFDSTVLINFNAIDKSQDIFIAKYDTSGKFIWAKSFGGTERDVSSEITSDTNENCYITGFFDSPTITFGKITFQNPTSFGILFIAKFNRSGEVVWTIAPDNIRGSSCGNSIVSYKEDLYITGSFEGAFIEFGNNQLVNHNLYNRDFFITKLSKYDPKDHLILIYPNPSSGQIKITCPINIQEVIITNVLGQIIYESKPNAEEVLVNLECQGMYFVTIKVASQTTVRKLLVER